MAAAGARRARAGLRLIGLAAAATLTAGCATYTSSNIEVRTMLEEQNWQKALDRIDAHEGGRDRLLELLQRGQVLHYAGRFDESNIAFQQAEDLAASLYTRSVSQQAASLIVNDLTIDYRGKPFELAMVPFYRAFNYLSLGDPEAAQVEARKASFELADAVEATTRELRSPGDREAARRLQDNGLLHWFAGMLFESDGAANDAFVAYRNAVRAYLAGEAFTGVRSAACPRPRFRASRSHLRLLDRGRRASPRGAEALSGRAPTTGSGPGGEVVFILETGWIAPRDQS